MTYFNDFFGIDESVLENYGAFNISLINDLPVFIDPFLLYGSTKPKYLKLHKDIVKYLVFLRDKSEKGGISDAEIKSWYFFQEIKQNWLGFSLVGNNGSGLAMQFGRTMAEHIHKIYKDINNEEITDSSHLEKAGLFAIGIRMKIGLIAKI